MGEEGRGGVPGAGGGEGVQLRLVDVLEAASGRSFDPNDGYAALEAELRCDQCGKNIV